MSEKTINLFDRGALLQLQVSYWSMRKMLTNTDIRSMGLDPERLPTDIVNWGRKLLVPRSERQAFVNLEGKARMYLAKFSVPFGVSSAHFVPATKLDEVCKRLDEIKEEFNTAAKSFVNRFEEMRDKVANDPRYQEFYEKCLKQVYPNPDELKDKFQFRFLVFKVAGLGQFTEGTIEDVVAQSRTIDSKTQTLQVAMQEEVQNFAKMYVETMRKEIVKFCELVSARINNRPYGQEDKPKTLTPRAVSCFRDQIDRFKSMNIFDDNDLSHMLDKLKEDFLIGVESPKERFESTETRESITNALTAIRDIAASQGSEMDEFLGQLKRRITI